MTFNETAVNRDTAGKFAEKTGSAAEVSLTPSNEGEAYAARYFDAHIASGYGDIPADHLEKQRAKYISDVSANPEAVEQLDRLYNPDSGVTDIEGTPIPKPLKNPFRKGQKVVIPAGTVVRFHGEEILTERKQTVTVHMTTEGYYDDSRSVHGWDRIRLRQPTVTWPGSGGYWKDATLDQDVLDANGLAPEYDARQVELWGNQLGRKKFVG